MTLLMHADRAVHAVVDDEDDDLQAVLHRGRKLLAHHEVAVAREQTTGRSGSISFAAIAAGRP